MTYQLPINQNTTFKEIEVESLSTKEFSTIKTEILDAYKNMDNIYDILVNKVGIELSIRVLLNNNYSNDMLVKLSERELQLLNKFDYYLFNFDYTNKKYYQKNSNEISLFSRSYADR